MIAENLRQISLTHLFKRSFDQEDISTITKQALSAQVPVTSQTRPKTRDKDSLDELLKDAV